MKNQEPLDAKSRVAESAKRFGVQLDEKELERWISAISTTSEGEDIVLDESTGVFGHKVSMLDFDPKQLAQFRAIGKIIEFEDVPGKIETALALSGSAAQSKIQTYPGDADFFERVNIIAPTRSEACQVLSKIMREKAINTMTGPNYQFIEAKYGSYPLEVVVNGKTRRKGSPISWDAKNVLDGHIEAEDQNGNPITINWTDVSEDPGWCKLDWLIADTTRKQLANASNMLDVTWEAPDGTITPLDGYLDGYFQEIYLDAQSAPIFNKLVKQMSSDTLDSYLEALEKETKKYFSGDNPNYGKACKRMYNVFRLNGRYEEAAFLRELFDEPAALLYQVNALIRTVEEAASKSEVFSTESILDQMDELIIAVVNVLEGAKELEIIRHLLKMYRMLAQHQEGKALGAEVEAAQAEVMNIVNNFFYEKMTAMPSIKEYVAAL